MSTSPPFASLPDASLLQESSGTTSGNSVGVCTSPSFGSDLSTLSLDSKLSSATDTGTLSSADCSSATTSTADTSFGGSTLDANDLLTSIDTDALFVSSISWMISMLSTLQESCCESSGMIIASFADIIKVRSFEELLFGNSSGTPRLPEKLGMPSSRYLVASSIMLLFSPMFRNGRCMFTSLSPRDDTSRSPRIAPRPLLLSSMFDFSDRLRCF